MDNACRGLAGALFGHKFRARYSIGTPTLARIRNCDDIYVAGVVEASKPRTYHGDVCERCGVIINNKGDGNAN